MQVNNASLWIYAIDLYKRYSILLTFLCEAYHSVLCKRGHTEFDKIRVSGMNEIRKQTKLCSNKNAGDKKVRASNPTSCEKEKKAEKERAQRGQMLPCTEIPSPPRTPDATRQLQAMLRYGDNVVTR